MNELRSEPQVKPDRQDKVAKNRDGRGRYRPIAVQEEIKEEIKEVEPITQESTVQDEIQTQLADEITPLIQQNVQPGEQQRYVLQDEVPALVENALGQASRRDIITNNKFISMVGAFLVGQLLDPVVISNIVKALHRWWVVSEEKNTLDDPNLDNLPIEERMGKPLPAQCKRIIYRDVQTGELKSIVQCGAQGERVYMNR